MEQEAWGAMQNRFATLKAYWQELSCAIDDSDELIANLLQNKQEAPSEGASFLDAPSVAPKLNWPDVPFAVEGAQDIRRYAPHPSSLELGDKVPLLKVATLLDGARRQIRVVDLALRKGRFSYLDNQSQWQPFDDYTIDTTVLLLGAFCNIRSPRGSFTTLLAEGKLVPSTLFHILKGTNPQETRYLRYCLAATPAANYLRGTNISERLELEGLSSILIPYPTLRTRLAFTRVMDLIEQEFVNLPSEILALLALGDELYRLACSAGSSTSKLSELAQLQAGSFCAPDGVGASSSVPIVSPQGIIARTTEALVGADALILGNLGPWLSLRYLNVPSAPNAETLFIGAPDSQIPLPLLFFALRACGAIDSAAESGARQARQGLTLEYLPELELAIPDANGFTTFVEQGIALLTLITALEQRREVLRELRWLLDRALLEGSLPTSLTWKQPTESTGRWMNEDANRFVDGTSPAIGADVTNDDLPSEYAEIPAAVMDIAFGILEEATERGIPKEALQLSFPPPNQTRWLNGSPDPADPRWIFGPPPATRANYAWIQQVLSAMGETSLAVILLCNAALHSEHPGERPLREGLVASGLVRAVIALPGRIFADGRPPSSLLVLEKDPDISPTTLFIDLQEAGLDVSVPSDETLQQRPTLSQVTTESIPGSDPDAAGDCSGRVLPDQVVAETLDLYRSYMDQGKLPPCKGGAPAMVVDQTTMSAHDSLLTPWTYTHPDEQTPTQLSTTETLVICRKLRKNTAVEFHCFLNM
jgi:hypothetical protein